jgi:hypothetical protein
MGKQVAAGFKKDSIAVCFPYRTGHDGKGVANLHQQGSAVLITGFTSD